MQPSSSEEEEYENISESSEDEAPDDEEDDDDLPAPEWAKDLDNDEEAELIPIGGESRCAALAARATQHSAAQHSPRGGATDDE